MAKTLPSAWLPSTHPCLSLANMPGLLETPEALQKTSDGLLGSLFFLVSPEGALPVGLPGAAGSTQAGERLTGAATTPGAHRTEVKSENVDGQVWERNGKDTTNSSPTEGHVGATFTPTLIAPRRGNHGNEPCAMSADELDSGGEELLEALPRQKRSRRRSWPCDLPTPCIDKEEQRKERNRKAQRKFRERQRSRILRLEHEARNLKDKLHQLEINNCELNRENEIMRSYMSYFGGPTIKPSQERAC